MADKAAEKKPESSAAAPQSSAADKKEAKGGLLAKTPVLLGAVMILEAGVLFAGFKFLGAGPKHASAEISEAAGEHGAESASDEHGGEHGTAAAGDKRKTIEVEILTFRAPNKLTGRTFVYDVSLYAVAKTANEKSVKATIEARKNLITDRIRTIIAQTDPEKLGGGSEPGLETLRRQVKYQLDQIVGEGMIDEVLVPRCIPIRTDY